MNRVISTASFLVLGLSATLANAQTATPTPDPSTQNVLVSEGIGGDIDKHRRGPVLSVGIKRAPAVVKLLVDTSIQNEQYADYPIQLDYYVNRMHFTSQIRSKALPGPLGIDVGSDYTAPPFNYTVVAKLLHPNREFTTVIEGAVFELDLAATLDCTLTRPVDGEEGSSKIYTESSVATVQLSNDTLLLNASALKTPNKSSTASVNGNVTVKNTDGTASGNITVIEGAQSASEELSGTFTSASGLLSSISLSSSDGETVVECS
jgi:hypothetical protein